MFRRFTLAGALILCWAYGRNAQAQDAPALARALERAEQYYVAIGPKPGPTAKWIGEDRLAFSAVGAAPWSVISARTGDVLESNAGDAAIGGPPSPMQSLPSWMVPKESASAAWQVRTENTDLVVTDNAGATKLRLPGEPRYGWGTPPQGGNRDRRVFVAMRMDQRAVHSVPIIDYRSPIESVSYASYTKTGTPLPLTELHVVDPAAGSSRPVKLDTRDAYVFFLGWRTKASEALVMRMSRSGKRLDLFAIDESGAVRLLAYDERPATFVAALDFSVDDWQWQITPLPDDSGFLWMSERDGWRHVYHYGFDGALKTQLTAGNFRVHRVVRVDHALRHVYMIASADSANPYDRHLYRVALDGTGFTALTSEPGQHATVFSASGDYFTDSYSSLAQPHTVDLRRADGTLVRRLGQASTAVLDAAGYQPPEEFSVKAADGKTDLFGVIYRPLDFDSTRRYPVIDYIYAGPQIAVHQTSYEITSSMSGLPAALAQMGFVVVTLDARGTPGRSKAFQDASYGRIGQGDVEIADHVAALRALGRSRTWIDTTRAGVVGHSWGGFFAINAMLNAPDFFKAGYAGAPGDLTEAASINEPNMGLLSDNPVGYDMGSNLRRASALRGRLKIMHGTSDVMAPLSTTMRMAHALIGANKPFDLLIMPGQPHGPTGAAGRYYREDVRRFMATHLPGAK